MILTLVVTDPPPTRADPGKGGDRSSPNAKALVRAAAALREAHPGVFPRRFSEVEVVFGRAMPDVARFGYQPEHAIYEVLQDVGIVIEPGAWSSRTTQNASAEFYVVTFTLDDP